MTPRYENMFEKFSGQKEGAFIPFVVTGDPDPGLSLNIIEALVEAGADALELGIPFSDPIADGPAIQAASVRALKKGVTPDECFGIIRKVRERNNDIPIGLLVYANLVVVNGMDDFYTKVRNSGVDSVLVADVPVAEAEPFSAAAQRCGIQPVLIAPPNASDEQIRMIAGMTRGYTYVVARSGVTGVRDDMELHHSELFTRLEEYGAPPPVLGFGISKPAHVTEAIASGAAGAISGSAVVKIITENLENPVTMLSRIKDFVRSMKAATCL